MKITKKSHEKSTEQKMAPWCGGCCFIFISILCSLAFIQVIRQIGGRDITSFNVILECIGLGSIFGIIFGVIMYLGLKYEWG